MKVTVTQEDIDNGVQWQPQQCPIARALARRTRRTASVGIWSAFLDKDTDEESEYALPVAARDFVFTFDTTGVGNPATFNLRKVTKYVTLDRTITF